MSKITPTNKIPRIQQSVRLNNGLLPQVRPVSNGSLTMKIGTRHAMNSPSGKRVKDKMLPHQFGQAPSGPEICSHWTRGQVASGVAFACQDIQNGFNAACRQAILDAQFEIWPEATQTMNNLYGHDSAVVYAYHNESGLLTYTIFWSQNGVKQGR